jgi:hypothetical protein
MKRSDGTQGKAPFTFTFHKMDCYATDPAHITAETLSEAVAQVPWTEAKYVHTTDSEGFFVF